MRRTNQEVTKRKILKIMDEHDLDTFPSRLFLEGIDQSSIYNEISRLGGFIKCADEWGIPRKVSIPKWSLSQIEEELRKYIKENNLKRMPSKPELSKVGRGDLGNALTRYKGMNYWSQLVDLPLKNSETTKGRQHEEIAIKLLESKGYSVERMTTKYPYDLLINRTVKIDIKVSSLGHDGRHTFATGKEFPTCDIYLCIGLNEKEQIERTFVIPAMQTAVKTFCIGGDSKYNQFIDGWKHIDKYSDFLLTI